MFGGRAAAFTACCDVKLEVDVRCLVMTVQCECLHVCGSKCLYDCLFDGFNK